MGKQRAIYYLIPLYLLLITFLVVTKIHSYQWNLWALAGIWQGFADLNPGYIEKNTLLFQDGGYDGQFFYLNARYLFSDVQILPKVDSFYFRFHRIGFSVFGGLFSSLFGFSHYALVSLLLLVALAVLAYALLNNIIKSSLVMAVVLFNPFVINSTLLLVSDSLFVSLLAISFYFFHRSGAIRFDQTASDTINNRLFLAALAFLALAIFTRETGILFAGAFFLYLVWQKKIRHALLLVIPVILFLGFVLVLRNIQLDFKGTSPLGFTDMIDWPLFGFVKSLDLQSFRPKALVVLPVFGFYLLLLLNLWNMQDRESFILLLPLLAMVAIATIAEQGYWRSFDNITRMFAPAVLWVAVLKNRQNYRDFGLMYYTLFFLFLLIVRIVVQKPLEFVVY